MLTPIKQRYARKGEWHPVWTAEVLDGCISAYTTLNRKLINVARAELSNKEEAPDLVAAVWLGVATDIIHRKIERWSDGLVWHRLKLRLVDEYRKPKVIQLGKQKESQTGSCETQVIVWMMVERLPDDERAVVEEKLAGYTFEEMTARVGLSKRTIIRKWNTALGRMSQMKKRPRKLESS